MTTTTAKRTATAPFSLRNSLLAALQQMPDLLPQRISGRKVTTSKAFAILTALVNRASLQGGIYQAWPSWSRIIKDVGGMGEETFRIHLRALQDAGFISRFYEGRTPVFQINLRPTPTAAKETKARKKTPRFTVNDGLTSINLMDALPYSEPALSEPSSSSTPDWVSIAETVGREVAEVALNETSAETPPAETMATPEPEPTIPVTVSAPSTATPEQTERIERSFPAIVAAGLIPAIYALSRRSGRTRAEILAAVEHGLTDTYRPPVNPLSTAVHRAKTLSAEPRMKAILHRARIALGEPTERTTAERMTEALLQRFDQERKTAVPLSQGLAILRANCFLLQESRP